jgi:succinate-acetate transporter protein
MTDDESSSVKKLANPAGLGLLAFGMTTVLLSFHNLGLFGLDSVILSMGIVYGGIAQIMAGIFEFKNGNTFGATAFTSYGLFWITFIVINTSWGQDALGVGETAGIAAYFAMWGIITMFLFIGTLKAHRMLQVVFLTLTILFFIVAIEKATEISDIAYVAGAVGIICGGSAMYTSFGEVINEQHGKTILPLG